MREIASTCSIYCFHMQAVIFLTNGNESQNCNKWVHATECRCSPFLHRVHMPDQINFKPSVDRTDIPFKVSLAPICLELSLGASHGAVNKF